LRCSTSDGIRRHEAELGAVDCRSCLVDLRFRPRPRRSTSLRPGQPCSSGVEDKSCYPVEPKSPANVVEGSRGLGLPVAARLGPAFSLVVLTQCKRIARAFVGLDSSALTARSGAWYGRRSSRSTKPRESLLLLPAASRRGLFCRRVRTFEEIAQRGTSSRGSCARCSSTRSPEHVLDLLR